jgi:PmbA protein
VDTTKKKAAVSTKLLPIILAPREVASALLSSLVLLSNGEAVLEESSPLEERLWEQVFDKKLSLWDDATVPYGVGSYPFDDRGARPVSTACYKWSSDKFSL